MEPKCALCHKTVEDLAEEELQESPYNRKSLSIYLTDGLAYPYILCESCDRLLRIVVQNILIELEIIDENKERRGNN